MKAVCLLLAVVASVAFAANTNPCAGVTVDTYAPINPPYSWDPQSANPLGYQRGRIYEGENWASPAACSGHPFPCCREPPSDVHQRQHRCAAQDRDHGTAAILVASLASLRAVNSYTLCT